MAAQVAAVLIAVFFFRASCIEDTAVLIQQRRTRGVVDKDDEASATERVLPEERLRSLPIPGHLGLTMTQLSTEGEPGSSLDLKFDQHCTEDNQSCVYFFGTPIRSWIEVKLADGFHVGDILASSFEVDVASYNINSFWAKFVPLSFALDRACSVCQGTCTFTKVDEVMYFGMETPTVLDNSTVCKDLESGKLSQETFIFANESDTWPFPPQDLHPELNITLGLGILSQDGTPRAAASYLFGMTQEEPQGVTAMIMQSIASKEEPAIGLVALVGKMVFDAVEQGLEVLNGSRSSKISNMRAKNQTSNVGHNVTVNFTIKAVESGTNLSFTVGENCTRPDSVGSFVCSVRMGHAFNYSFAINTTASVEEGSTVRFKTYVNVSGAAGVLINAMNTSVLPSEEINMPYCGNKTKILFRGKNITVKLPRCGDYKLEMMNFIPVPQFLADFDDFPLPEIEGMPLMPLTFNQLLPASFTTEADIRHKDGSPMFSAVVSFTMQLRG